MLYTVRECIGSVNAKLAPFADNIDQLGFPLTQHAYSRTLMGKFDVK